MAPRRKSASGGTPVAAAAGGAGAGGGGKLKALVTGGAGLLGQHLVQQLLDSGRYTVVVFDIRECAVPGAVTILGDLRKPAEVAAACAGCDVVFHCATVPPTGANALNNGLMHSVNVQGTANVIEACKAAKVPRLIYTSSASVVFDGQALVNVDETQPYAKR